MKTQQWIHKHILFFLLLTVFTTSCVGIFGKKDKDPEPELAGTYTVSSYRITSGTRILPGSSGTVKVTGPTNNRIGLAFTLPVIAFDYDDIEVRKNGNSYDMYDGGTKVGSVDGANFNIDAQGSDDDGQYIRFEVTAKK